MTYAYGLRNDLKTEGGKNYGTAYWLAADNSKGVVNGFNGMFWAETSWKADLLQIGQNGYETEFSKKVTVTLMRFSKMQYEPMLKSPFLPV